MYSDGNRVVQQIGDRTVGGAYANYQIVNMGGEDVLETIRFQYDTIPNIGVVGATNECLLAIVLDRLEAFQIQFPCVENEIAINGCRAALKALEYRTQLRLQRGVEGKCVK